MERRKLSKEAWVELGTKLYGDDMLQWKFVCPICGNIQTPEDFRKYKDEGATPDVAAYNCIGRYQKNPGNMSNKKKPCDYTSYGLLRLAPWTVIGDQNSTMFSFAFADATDEMVDEFLVEMEAAHA